MSTSEIKPIAVNNSRQYCIDQYLKHSNLNKQQTVSSEYEVISVNFTETENTNHNFSEKSTKKEDFSDNIFIFTIAVSLLTGFMYGKLLF